MPSVKPLPVSYPPHPPTHATPRHAIMVRIKRANRSDRTIAAVAPHTHPRPNPVSRSIRDFIKVRLQANPLTKNGRIKRECKTLADEIAFRLMSDARKGKLEAIRLLIEASEGNILRQRVVNYYIERIYNAIESIVTDEDQLYQIGKALYHLKHRINLAANAYVPHPTYTGPQDLDRYQHENPDVAARLKHPPLLGSNIINPIPNVLTKRTKKT